MNPNNLKNESESQKELRNNAVSKSRLLLPKTWLDKTSKSNSGYAQPNFALQKVKSSSLRNLLALKKIVNFAYYGFRIYIFNNLNFQKITHIINSAMNLLLTPQQQNGYPYF